VIVGPAMVATETACCPKFPHSVHLAPARKQLSAHLVEVGQRKHGAPDAPACADRKAAVIQDSALRQQGITSIRLPLGSGADHHGDLLAFRVHISIFGSLENLPPLFVAFGWMDNALRPFFRISRDGGHVRLVRPSPTSAGNRALMDALG
jgi:hypothetical protein